MRYSEKPIPYIFLILVLLNACAHQDSNVLVYRSLNNTGITVQQLDDKSLSYQEVACDKILNDQALSLSFKESFNWQDHINSGWAEKAQIENRYYIKSSCRSGFDIDNAKLNEAWLDECAKAAAHMAIQSVIVDAKMNDQKLTVDTHVKYCTLEVSDNRKTILELFMVSPEDKHSDI
ncbi:hypothetical protein [Thalassotalea sp. Y01]|uniref:hypothetical protein n=1 Tax=Thalassotalea sp. Y01 TaxID=2729613 RepID=UPI00145E01C4|nr:hypothetical protein [Thalassotalea sp. Y01]NMP17087.1 hypothetical protein [Thalassotalea sp. Y01]